MGIYNVEGNQINYICDGHGESVNQAYDIAGSLVFKREPHYDYDDYSISNIIFALTGSNYQGFAVHNNVVAQFQANDKLTLVDINGTVISSQLPITSMHGQSAFFMNDYYDSNDEFPLLACMASYTLTRINRITRYNTTLLKTIYIPTSVQNGGYKTGNAFNSSNNHMFTFGYTNENYRTDDGGTNKLILAEWDLSDLTDNGDNTFTPRLIGVQQRDFIVCIQGSCFYDGIIWASSGVGGAASHVYAFDPFTFEILHTITLSNTEIEGCAWVNDYLLVGQNPSNISYRKVTFAEL